MKVLEKWRIENVVYDERRVEANLETLYEARRGRLVPIVAAVVVCCGPGAGKRPHPIEASWGLSCDNGASARPSASSNSVGLTVGENRRGRDASR